MSKFYSSLFYLIFILASSSSFLLAQVNDIYLPPSIKTLYEGETRSYDGKPGKSYWQNRADYIIDARLIPESREIIGKQKITYYNNSPDELDLIVIQLFQNIYKKGNSRDWDFREESINDGVKINKIKINDVLYELDSLGHVFETNFFIEDLPENISPNSTITLEMEWEFELPEFSKLRMGAYDENVFFTSYWYPKIAVYDDVYGWDKLVYTGRTEFYSDNNNYDVRITLPGDYVCWATGVLHNPKSVLSEDVFNRYQTALTSDKVVRIVREEDYEELNVTADNGENIWHFMAKDVPDFSFACSDEYLWDGVSAVVDGNGSRVFTDAAYAPGTPNYENAALVSKRSIEYLSFDLPAVPFPFPQMTSFCNNNYGGGMETPMMANNGAPRDSSRFQTLILHEINHSYFPFYVLTNERRFSWMDESWATYFPREYSNKFLKDYNHMDFIASYMNYFGYETEENIPLIAPSNSLSGKALSANSYGKSYIAMLELQKMLGDEIFINALQEYIARWKHKHPLPYDFFFTLNDVTGENLNWFWKALFYDFGICDYALKKNKNDELLLIKAGELPASIEVQVIYEDDSEEIIFSNIRLWKENITQIKLTTDESKKIKVANILLDNTHDSNHENNSVIFND